MTWATPTRWWMRESKPKRMGSTEAFWDFHLRYCDAMKRYAGFERKRPNNQPRRRAR